MEINLSNILYDIENLLYEFFLDMALYPKTVIRAFLSPSWIHSYVTEEWQKGEKERFKDYLNPLIFWILSYIVILWAVSINNKTPLTLEHFVIKLMVWSLFPITYTAIMLRLRKIPLNQRDFRRPLYVQMMVFGVDQTVLGLIFAPLMYLNVVHSFFMNSPTGAISDTLLWGIHVFLVLALFIPFFWTIAAQVIILNKEFVSDLSKVLIGWMAGLPIFIILILGIGFIEQEALYAVDLFSFHAP